MEQTAVMKVVAVFILLLSLLVTGRAEDQVWALTDGRVVTVNKVLSQTPTHVTVRCTVGLLQIDKRKLPPELQEKFPYDSAAATAAQRQQEQEKALRESLAAKEQAMAERQRQIQLQQRPATQPAVRILSMRAAGPAIAYVMIENRSADAIDVGKDSFTGVNAVGASFPSGRLTNPRGDMLRRVRIAAGETAEVGVVFKIPPEEIQEIGTVRWR